MLTEGLPGKQSFLIIIAFKHAMFPFLCVWVAYIIINQS